MIIRVFEENDGYHEMSIIAAKIEDNEQFATSFAEDLLEILKPSYEEIGSGYYKELAKAQTDEFEIEIINSYNQALRGGEAVTKILIEKI